MKHRAQPRSRIITAHVMDGLRQIEDESVHCVVTSPPYYGLRSYGSEPQVWGGDPNCQHEFETEFVKPQSGGTGEASAKQVTNGGTQGGVQQPIERAFCHCGAWRGDLGLEPTPSCGRQGMVRLRKDLTADQREYVARRLLGEERPDVVPNGKADKAQRRSPDRSVHPRSRSKE